MYTQFFGHYLLNQKIVSPKQLEAALAQKNTTRAKLGALAIDAGYMTAEQVEAVHAMQRQMDKRIGDIAIDMGYLNETQVDELLSRQKTANIVLGQALIDNGALSISDFEKALREYKFRYAIKSDAEGDNDYEKQITSAFKLDRLQYKDFYKSYISLLLRNIIRFIGDDFVPKDSIIGMELAYEYLSSQEIKGKISAYTAVCGGKAAYYQFASRYAGEELTDSEYADAAVGEFLNLQNGLYSVNASNTQNIELSLTPQTSDITGKIKMSSKDMAIPLSFTFGTIYIILMGRDS